MHENMMWHKYQCTKLNHYLKRPVSKFPTGFGWDLLQTNFVCIFGRKRQSDLPNSAYYPKNPGEIHRIRQNSAGHSGFFGRINGKNSALCFWCGSPFSHNHQLSKMRRKFYLLHKQSPIFYCSSKGVEWNAQQLHGISRDFSNCSSWFPSTLNNKTDTIFHHLFTDFFYIFPHQKH